MAEHLSSQPTRQFLRERKPSASGELQLIKSYCLICSGFVAASPNPEVIKIVERLHPCVKSR
jgi:hypothetical protein